MKVTAALAKHSPASLSSSQNSMKPVPSSSTQTRAQVSQKLPLNSSQLPVPFCRIHQPYQSPSHHRTFERTALSVPVGWLTASGTWAPSLAKV